MSLELVKELAYLDLLIGIGEGKFGVISIVDIDGARVDDLDLGNGSKLSVQSGSLKQFQYRETVYFDNLAYLSRLIFLLPNGFRKA